MLYSSRTLTWKDVEYENDNDYDDDDDVSVADTLYSKRQRSCSRWVDEHRDNRSFINPVFDGYELRDPGNG